jgi:hypothetical protein
MSRRVTLPHAMTVTDEWGRVLCPEATPCSSFETTPLVDGESVLYWLS